MSQLLLEGPTLEPLSIALAREWLCVEHEQDNDLIGALIVSASHYPATTALLQLAVDCRAIRGAGVKLSYVADWTEYGAHVLPGGDIRFPLDPLWGNSHVDFVGLDAYWPLSDWRDGADHADAAIARSVYDPDYLHSRMRAGEAYDWYYANVVARLAQDRTPIHDALHGKHWIFRQKDLAGWWSNAHFERVAGVEVATQTNWIPGSKPIWIIETGCPAVDRGANAPNVFPDLKSSEGGLPYFSRGYRDDLMQARTLDAFLRFYDPADEGFDETCNPVSTMTGARMVDVAHIHLWAWDARPFPAFPSQSSVWGDASNWRTGHWLNGRLENVGLDHLVKALAADVMEVDLPLIDGMVDGYVLERSMSPRASIEPMGDLFGFDLALSNGSLTARMRDAGFIAELQDGDLVPARDGSLVSRLRGQESEIASELALTFWDSDSDYRTATASARHPGTSSQRQSRVDLGIVLQRAQAQKLVDIAMDDTRIQRDTVSFRLPRGALALEPGDCVRLQDGPPLQITKISDGAFREVQARAIEPSIYDRPLQDFEPTPIAPPRLPGPPFVQCLDLAVARGETPALQYIAASADPWTGPLAVWRAVAEGSFEFVRTIDHRAIVGRTITDLPDSLADRLDHVNSIVIELGFGALSSVSVAEMLGGRNLATLIGPDGAAEIVGFANAELVGVHQWRLSNLLRGLGGESHLASRSLSAGATFVLLDSAVVPLATGLSQLGAVHRYRIGPAASDYADPACVEVLAQVGAKVLLPYAPVRPKAVRTAEGVRFEFLRRGRLDADVWEPLDIPLGEEREAYEIEILSGASVIRTLQTVPPSVLYGAAEEIADFGAAQSVLSVRIYQISALVGRGFPLMASVPVH